MSSIAIITARGGSKRIPRKNIKPFLDKPIIQYSIEAALQSCLFDEVMVSTDDAEIAEIATQCGAIVPFMRSAATANDYTITADVLLEVLDEYAKSGRHFDELCCLYPTAPFVTAKKLVTAHAKLHKENADGLLPITRFSFPILRSFKVENELVSFNWPEYTNTRSQDLKPAFHDCGQFYFFKTEPFLKNKCLVGPNTSYVEVPESEVQDIDTLEDWIVAEMKYQMLNLSDKTAYA